MSDWDEPRAETRRAAATASPMTEARHQLFFEGEQLSATVNGASRVSELLCGPLVNEKLVDRLEINGLHEMMIEPGLPRLLAI